MAKLKRCPFCGRTDTLLVTDCREIGECDNYIECDHIGPDVPWQSVVCDFNKGGCGGASGYAVSKAEAIEKWNTRADK